MHLINYLALSVSPILAIVFISYLRFKFSIKSWKNIRNAIILGLVSIIILLIAYMLIEAIWGGKYNNMRRMAFFVFVVVAFSSELGKFLPLRFAFYRLKNFTGPIEGIIYSIFISLGFSFMATILYGFEIIDSMDKFNNFTLFLFTMPLANLVFAIAMGFFVGMGALRKNNRFIDMSTGLFVATFFHGLYYFGFVTSDIRLLIFDAIGFVIISVTFLTKAVSLKYESNK